jgi:hypothetical protein
VSTGKDSPPCRGRLRHVHGVTARSLNYSRAGPLGHGALGGRRDHQVLGRDQVPAWLGSPRRLADRPTEGVHAPRDLRVGHECGQVGRQVACERRMKLLPIQEQEPSLGGRIGGRGPPCGKVPMSVFTDSPLSGEGRFWCAFTVHVGRAGGRGDHLRFAEYWLESLLESTRLGWALLRGPQWPTNRALLNTR